MHLDEQIVVITSKQSAILDQSNTALSKDSGVAFFILTCHMPSTSELHILLGTTAKSQGLGYKILSNSDQVESVWFVGHQ
jgi:hypothetical protein